MAVRVALPGHSGDHSAYRAFVVWGLVLARNLSGFFSQVILTLDQDS